jgi:O-antigen ligase
MNTDTTNRLALIIDKLIFFFVIIFLASLTNSIFLNQLGYYGALLLMLAKFFISKKSPFQKNGLEYFFTFFVISLILATLFSANHTQSLNNLLKRVFLIPIVYTVSSTSFNFKKLKLFFWVYMGAASLSILVYLFFSAKHFIYNLYQIQQSGPGVFQYPITASEIMCFTLIFFFAFLINEKQNWKLKLLSATGFLLSSLALFATYKRTGWIGAAAGIIVILIIKKKWLTVASIILIVIILFVVEKDESKILVYNTNENKLVKEEEFSTEGRAWHVLADSNFYLVSDYENGLLCYSENGLQSTTKFPSPIVEVKKINDSLFIACLIDTRFILLEKRGSNFKKLNEFYSKGFTVSTSVYNKSLYALDKDYGLTIFKNVSNLSDTVRFPLNDEHKRVVANSTYITLQSFNNTIKIFAINNFAPSKLVAELKPKQEIIYLDMKGNRVFVATTGSLNIYRIDSTNISLIYENKELNKILNGHYSGGFYFLLDLSGNVIKFSLADFKSEIIAALNYIPGSLSCTNNKLYATKLKTSRIASFLDPYNPSNFNRIALWSAGWRIFLDYPFFGVGDIDLAKFYIEYKKPYEKEIQGHLHNNYIHLLVTLGLFGFIAVMFLIIKIFLLDWKIYHTLKDVPFASSYSLGVIGGYVAFLFAGLTEWNFGDHEIITIIWFTLGLNLAFNHSFLKQKSTI